MVKNTKNKAVLYGRLKDIAASKDGRLLSEEYITAKTKYKFECKYNHIFEMTADKVTGRGDWCPYCSGRYGNFHDELEEFVKSHHHGKLIGEYVNNHTKIKCECKRGHIFSSSPNNIKAGKWCPYCRESHGEKIINRYLREHGYIFKTQYRFSELVGRRNTLPFDFALFDCNGKLLCLIEYQGEQHFNPMRHSDNEEANYEKHLSTVYNDNLKKKYCLDNNIKLIEVTVYDCISHSRIEYMIRDIYKKLDIELKAI